MTPSKAIIASFWAKVQKSEGCWLWIASGQRSGYGQFWVVPARLGGIRPEGAHRAAWIITYGAIPPGLYVLHHCDNKRCVRPDHLFLGTQKTNIADLIAKDRLPRGERRAWAKLVPSQVQEIRQRAAQGTLQKVLAAQFSVSPGTVQKIIGRKKWRHVA